MLLISRSAQSSVREKKKKPRVIYYASKTLDPAQINYTTIEKELLAIIFALDNFRSYLIGIKVIVFSNHSALKHLLSKKKNLNLALSIGSFYFKDLI